MHCADCFNQKCDTSSQKCGQERFGELFRPLSNKLGKVQIELFQHVQLKYTKPDGAQVKISFFPISLQLFG